MKLADCSCCGRSPRIFSSPVSVGHNEYIRINYVMYSFCKTRGPVFADFDFPLKDDRVRFASESWNKIHAKSEG